MERKAMEKKKMSYQHPAITPLEIVCEDFLLTSSEDENQGEWDSVEGLDGLMDELLPGNK